MQQEDAGSAQVYWGWVCVWVCVCVCARAHAMLGMSGNFSEQMLRSICSGECQVEAAGLISHQPPCIEGL